MTEFNTVIEVEKVAELLAANDVVVVDCRFYLDDESAGRKAYEVGHIPSAQYLHLNEDLSDLEIAEGGRHPLPSGAAMADLFGRLGISAGNQVVAYDDANGAAAARLWWMLQYMGHRQVAVLNGGFPAWRAAGFQLVPGIEQNDPLYFEYQARPELLVQMADVDAVPLLVDSRAPERYRGDLEPIDPVAGHIPGAISHFYQNNYGKDGRFLPPAVLRRQFAELLGENHSLDATFYCGSGVTACNNLLALAYSGLGHGRLYIGSWSQWCSNPLNPVAVTE